MHKEFLPEGNVKRGESSKELDLGKLMGPDREDVRENAVDLACSQWRQMRNFSELHGQFLRFM
jgi:hypothetical protein